jgi:hypothetical protein
MVAFGAKRTCRERRELVSQARLTPEPTCGAQDLERSIDVSLSANLDGSGLIANDPDHNQFVDVSYFAQTPGEQRRKLITIDTPSQKPHQR